MINTLNETHLHRTLKTLYALREEGSVTEAPVGKSIADILTPAGNVIEIQTGSLSHLAKKIERFLGQGRRVTVVYPLVKEKYIETRNAANGTMRRKKSPKKQNVYCIFRELTGLYSILLNKNFTLEVPEVTVAEERRTTEEPVQSANGMRRFKKNWLKTGKRLEAIHCTHVFHAKKSYLDLLPPQFTAKNRPLFTVAELKKELQIQEEQARLMMWLYGKMEITERTGKQGNAYLYRVL